MTYDPDCLSRELYNRSAILTQVAHTFSSAADQLVQAHSGDYSKSAADVRTAAYSAVRAALSACELFFVRAKVLNGAPGLGITLEVGRTAAGLR